MLIKNYIYIAVTCIITLSSCGDEIPKTPAQIYREQNQVQDTPMYMGELPADNSPYSKGFRDGCNSAISTVGIGFIKTNRDQIYIDHQRKITDAEYHKGWNMGHNYCTYYLDVDPL